MEYKISQLYYKDLYVATCKMASMIKTKATCPNQMKFGTLIHNTLQNLIENQLSSYNTKMRHNNKNTWALLYFL